LKKEDRLTVNLQLGQDMLIDDRYPAEHGTDNSKKALIGAGNKEIAKADISVFGLGWIAVNGSAYLRCVTLNSNRSKGVFIYNICRETANYILKALAGAV
jgi:hypothetical protein